MQTVRLITKGVSNGARSLRDTLRDLGVPCNKVDILKNPKLNPKACINIKWGCFTAPACNGSLLNGIAGDQTLNKLTCFQRLKEMGVPVPAFTTDSGEAAHWLSSGQYRRVYQRNLLRGSEGDGIVVVEADKDGKPVGDTRLSPAPLYVSGCFGKRREYRIHVFNVGRNTRTFVQQKKLRTTGVEKKSEEARVRNLASGWVFAHKDIQAPREETIVAAISAIDAFDLHFGAVDIIEMDQSGCFVLEINCAPGLQGATLFFYADAIKEVLIEPTESEE